MKARQFRKKIPFILTIALISPIVSQVSTESASAQLVITVPGDQPTIQSAIDVAAAGDTVLVAPGTYVENINFQGKAVTVESEQGPEATVIDGNLAGPVVTFASGEGLASMIRGFTLQRGRASNGGGVRINASSPTVAGNIITNNMACGGGGGVEADNSSARIEHNLITNNGQWSDCSGGPGGGGIGLVGAGQTQILGNTIMGNSWSSSSGGGITLFAAGAPVIRDNVIKANSAFYYGGGLWIVNRSDASIVQNLIVDNRAGKGGGIYFASAGTRGMLLVNNTIAGNHGLGSAIFASFIDAKAQLFNNLAIGTSGQPAVFCDAFDNLNPPIFVSNNVHSAGGSAYGGVCVDPTGANGNLSVDPVFVDAAGGDYHLAAGSPSINAGDNAAPELPATDIDGDRRVMNGRVDQGVDEFPAATAPPQNDDIGSPVVIDSLPFGMAQSTIEATPSEGDPLCLDERTVWYRFTPTSDIGLDVNTFGSDYDTNVGVFYGNPSDPTTLSAVMCNDDAPGHGLQSQVTFSAPAGLTLFIGVGGPGGNLAFSATQIPAPANDDFVSAQVISALPFSDTLDVSGASRDPGQPSTGCSRPLNHSVWYAFTPSEDAPVTATLVEGVVGVFTGTSIDGLDYIACSAPGIPLTVRLTADTPYYFAVSDDNSWGGVVTFNLTGAPSPVADFHYYPHDPSPFSPVSFTDDSFDPGGNSFASRVWDFGDGASAFGCCPDHQYATDGDYTVTLSVTTTDGRTDSASRIVSVRTHDVTVVSVDVPKTATLGSTKAVTVSVASANYTEDVHVWLLRSVPGGFETVDLKTQTIPAGTTVAVRFAYTFTSADASLGTIAFRGQAVIADHVDPIPADNVLTSASVRIVGRR